MTAQNTMPVLDPMKIEMAEMPQREASDHPDEVQDVVWFNPTTEDAVLDIQVGTSPLYGIKRALTREERTGLRQYVIRAGQRRRIPAEHSLAIQQYECIEPECTHKKMLCRNSAHRRRIVGGLHPHLVNESTVTRPRLAEALDTIKAEKAMAETAALAAKKAKDEAEYASLKAQQQLEAAIRDQREREALYAQREAEMAAKQKALEAEQAKIAEVRARIEEELAAATTAGPSGRRKPAGG